MKGAHLSTIFSVLILERNLIYLTPLVVIATVAVLARPLTTLPALAAALAAALLLLENAALRLDRFASCWQQPQAQQPRPHPEREVQGSPDRSRRRAERQGTAGAWARRPAPRKVRDPRVSGGEAG